MSNTGVELSREIMGRCRALGFALAGVCEAAPSVWAHELSDWLGEGRHGSMEYLEQHLEVRLDPRRLLEGARSLIVVADQYGARGEAADLPLLAGRGRIARYARGRDYHVVMKKRLHDLCDSLRGRFPGAGFRAFVDTAPVLEREHAARAGLGWIGKHTLLIDPRVGSFLLLGGVATTLALPPPPDQRVVSDHCGTCTRCIDSCPTGAISPYSVDASRCISYLTIERREAIDAEFFGPIGEWLYGCDVCQEVCPHNSPREEGAASVNPAYRQHRDSFRLLDVLGWKEDDRRAEFAGTPLKRATLAMMKRNALIVAGNALRRQWDDRLRAAIERIAGDEHEDEMVRRTAAEVVESLPE